MTAFAGFQVALALGAPWGRMTWGGASDVLPPALRLASAGAAVVLLASAATMLVRSGDLGRRLPQRLFWWINLALVVQLALNTAGNLASSEPGERLLMSAASTLIGVLCLTALFGRAGRS